MSSIELPEETVQDRIRVTDLDFQRHMGNTAFTDLFANARFTFLNNHVRPAVGQDEAFFVLVRLEVDFIRQVHHPATVETTTRPVKVGRSSLRLRQQMRSDGELVATAESVMVLAERDTGQSKPWPEEIAQWRVPLTAAPQNHV
jgi:acyl-CoA thioester hydrolase